MWRAWAEGALAIPFVAHGRDRSGADCWGLVTLAYRDLRSVDLPAHHDAYAGIGPDDARDLRAAMRGRREGWSPRSMGSELPGDVALIRVGRCPVHVGLVIDADARWLTICHTKAAGGVRIERMRYGERDAIEQVFQWTR